MTDTAEKRRSAAHVDLWFGPGVTPNNSKDQEWRQQAGWGYSGILSGGAPVVTGNPRQKPFMKNLSRLMDR